MPISFKCKKNYCKIHLFKKKRPNKNGGSKISFSPLELSFILKIQIKKSQFLIQNFACSYIIFNKKKGSKIFS